MFARLAAVQPVIGPRFRRDSQPRWRFDDRLETMSLLTKEYRRKILRLYKNHSATLRPILTIRAVVV